MKALISVISVLQLSTHCNGFGIECINCPVGSCTSHFDPVCCQQPTRKTYSNSCEAGCACASQCSSGTCSPTPAPTIGPYDISCSDVISQVSGSNDDASTSVSCPPGTDLVSCGLKTHDPTETNMDGVYYDETNNRCTARNGVHSPDGIYATARCCIFGIDISCNRVSGALSQSDYNGQDHSTASCNSDQQLTGCNGFGAWTRIGSYPGDPLIPPNLITNFNINYDATNICTARNGDTSRIKAYGECCSSSSTEYTLDCITRYGEGSLLSQISCPNEYSMIGCSGYGILGNTNAWYIENDICYSRSSNTQNTWASAICCAVSQRLAGKAPKIKLINDSNNNVFNMYGFGLIIIVSILLILNAILCFIHWNNKIKHRQYVRVKYIDSDSELVDVKSIQ